MVVDVGGELAICGAEPASEDRGVAGVEDLDRDLAGWVGDGDAVEGDTLY